MKTRTWLALCVFLFCLGRVSAETNRPATGSTLREEVEAAGAASEKEAAELEAEAGALMTEIIGEGKKLEGEAAAEARKLGRKAVEETRSFLQKEAPVVETDLKKLNQEAATLDRQIEPEVVRDISTAESEVLAATREATERARARIKAADLWLSAFEEKVRAAGKLKVDDELLRLNLISPGLGTYAVDELRYLKRASLLEIHKGETAVDRKAARLLHQTRKDLGRAGHWVHEKLDEGEKALLSEAAKAKRAVLAAENKADFWLEGRPLTDREAQAVVAHNNLLVSEEFPSAMLCAECHPGQYRQWSVSQHAYAQLSPVFNAMSERINRITNGTNGDFCIRCHNAVGMSIKEPIFIPNEDRLPVTREGVSCIVCHRVKNAYGRVSGRFGIEKGNLTKAMYGPLDSDVLNEVLDQFDVTTDAAAGALNWQENGAQVIHGGAIQVKTFSTTQLCSNCHDVNSQNVFRLEEAYSQFRNSPSAAQGIVCQDCHMGKVLGKVSGYDEGPIAYIGGVPTPVNKRTNHMFAGPDYTIVHPGIFPHHPEAESIASFKEWLQFDIEAGWGTKHFESTDHAASDFPPAWRKRRHRLRAAEFLKDQLLLISQYRAESFRTLRYGYQLGKFRVTRNNQRGLAFQLEVRNATSGHNVPTGFDGEREVFLHVVVRDHDEKIIFQSGDRDPNGDVRNLHSEYVRKNAVPLDHQLFSLQAEFLELSAHGGERERILPIPVSQGALPFLRPNESSSLLIAHPTNTRKQSAGIPPLGRFQAKYKIPARDLSGRPPYSVELTFIAQMVPVNLINEISSVGFDYDLSPRDVANRVVLGGFPLWSHRFTLGPAGSEKDLTPTDEEIMGPDSVSPALPWLNLPQSWIRELQGHPVTVDE